MAKFTPDAVLDATLNDVAESDTLYVCSAEPATFAGISAVELADVALTPGQGNGDFTLGAGTPSGRALTVAAQEDFLVDADGTASHVVLANAAGTTLKYVTTCGNQALTNGNTVSTSAWTITLPQPT